MISFIQNAPKDKLHLWWWWSLRGWGKDWLGRGMKKLSGWWQHYILTGKGLGYYVYENTHLTVYFAVVVWSLSHVWLSLTPWTAACQASVHGISQARTLEWVVISFSRGSFQPRDQTHVSCLTGRFFITEP